MDYTYGYWLNGFRKAAQVTTPDILCFETGRFGMAFDIGDMKNAHFGFWKEALDYESSLEKGALDIAELSPAKFNIDLEVGGNVYTASRSTAVDTKGSKRMQAIRMWESGRMGQNYDFLDLEFKNKKGEVLECKGSLKAVILPESMSYTATLEPAYNYQQGSVTGRVKGAQCSRSEKVNVPHKPQMESEKFTFDGWINMSTVWRTKPNTLLCKNIHQGRPGAFGFKVTHSSLIAFANIGGYQEVKQKGQILDPDKWHHLALSYDGNILRFYINGAEQGNAKVGKKRALGNQPFILGGNPHGSPIVFDEFKMWNRALSLAEIKNLYSNPEKAANFPLNQKGLVYKNSFDEGFVPKPPLEWENAKFGITLETDEKTWQNVTDIKGKWTIGQPRNVSLNCYLDDRVKEVEKLTILLQSDEYNFTPVKIDNEYGCYVSLAKKKPGQHGKNRPEYRKYDDIEIFVNNPSASVKKVPLMIDLRGPDSITGMVPMLCDEEGVPLGVPVQLSKNWHYNVMGAYFRPYVTIPITKGLNKFKLRIAYGFYGTVPSASHAQLSLVGYGGNGRWDQLAIGAYGETICFDIDMSLVDVAVTDVRGLMFRKGKEGKKWGWTDAGGGGDWLGLFDEKRTKLAFSGMKTAYLSHGPCLTHVKYNGFYGEARIASIEADLKTLRTNDYARTFQNLRYEFKKPFKSKGTWLYQLGGRNNETTPQIATGDREGMVMSKNLDPNLKKGEKIYSKMELKGEAPWWFAFPGTGENGKMPMGYRGLIIRSFKASFGGKEYLRPNVTFVVNKKMGTKSNIILLMEPHPEVTEYQPGDYVEMDTEWMTLSREVDDYYGNNKDYIDHLTKNPSSWKTIYREAIGNDLVVQTDGGKVINRYPIEIKAEAPEVTVEIKGGIGYVPITFEGLELAKGYEFYEVVNNELVELDQAVKGNDYWQTVHDTKNQSYKRTYNIPLDGKPTSKWLLRKTAN